MELHGQHILGSETAAAGVATFHARSPATGEQLMPGYHEATQAEIDHALALAVDGFAGLKAASREQRAVLLEKIADAIEALGEQLLERANQETALPIPRLTMERGRTVGQLRMFAGVVRDGFYLDARIDHAEADREPLPKPDVRRMLQPIGPVVVFGASNFPLAFSVAGGDTASALAAGCPVVVKGHPAHPGTSELAARAIQTAVRSCDLPAGTFSLVHGASPDVGRLLVEHPSTCAVGFTGSLKGGKALFDLAAGRPEPIPVYAEMGSTNPVFLLPGALAERGAAIAQGLQQSVTLGVGQFCTNPGLVVVVEDAATGAVTRDLLGRLAELMSQTPAGTMLHAGIAQDYRDGVARYDVVEGVQRLAPPQVTPPTGCEAPAMVFTTDATTFLSNPVLHDEVFGPCTVVVRCGSVAEMLRVADNLAGQLTATVHGTDGELREHRTLIDTLADRAGRVVLNSYPTGVELCPSMHHGGPFPATTAPQTTSVGSAAIQRFLRPVCYQDFPQELLPRELRDDNRAGILRLVDGTWTRERTR
ncbi:MAG: aldehyde dehydrogenase (NADP(+)) [Planctomycetota bacterium]|jgi:NADP-dependent aldehyde dehydrogenase